MSFVALELAEVAQVTPPRDQLLPRPSPRRSDRNPTADFAECEGGKGRRTATQPQCGLVLTTTRSSVFFSYMNAGVEHTCRALWDGEAESNSFVTQAQVQCIPSI